jgi:DGQHR domain-containing protein
MPEKELHVPAIEVNQSPGKTLYMFAVDGKLIHDFAAVSRIRREDDKHVVGYQRPEVLSHIAEIRNYIESGAPMIPNAVVVAFDPRVRFEPSQNWNGSSVNYSRPGTLVIPVSEQWEANEKPGFIVDGQQRIAAIRDSNIDSFPICVTAFITSDTSEQTEQFILVNSTKPLPKGLIYELLPNTEGTLSTQLQRRRFPARLLELLNTDPDSPFHGLIQTPTNPRDLTDKKRLRGIIKDNSILKMLENSLSDGVLHDLRYGGDGPDIDAMLSVLNNYWSAVREVFPEAWGKDPAKSRLMHGAGIVSMGFLMDAICARYRKYRIPSFEQFKNDILPLQPISFWTGGKWLFGNGKEMEWNEVQNIPRHIEILTNHILYQYKTEVWSRDRRRFEFIDPNQNSMF